MSSAPRITHRIVDAIRRQIANGVLAPGAPLPSTRALAEEWGVSRTTVTAAYEQLIAEGYLDARQGARTRVASGLLASPATRPTLAGTPARLSAYGRVLAEFDLPPQPGVAPRIADFRYGDLSSADFPRLAWRKAVNATLLRPGARLRYGDPRGSPRLREALQGYLWRARGLRCEAEQVIVVNGSQQGLDLCARLLLEPGDRAAIEDPGYLLARQVFLATGRRSAARAGRCRGAADRGVCPRPVWPIQRPPTSFRWAACWPQADGTSCWPGRPATRHS